MVSRLRNNGEKQIFYKEGLTGAERKSIIPTKHIGISNVLRNNLLHFAGDGRTGKDRKMTKTGTSQNFTKMMRMMCCSMVMCMTRGVF